MPLNTKLLIFAAAAVVLGAGLGPAGSANAAVPEKCVFDSRLSALTEIQKNTGALDAIRDELKLRRELLQDIIACSAEEARKLQSSVKEVSGQGAEIDRLRNLFAGQLEDFVKFYDLRFSRTGDLGLQGSKDLARELAEWRASVYAPLAAEAANLVIWSRNQVLFETATVRFNQITYTIKALKLWEREEFQVLAGQTEGNLANAFRLNRESKEALLRRASPETSSNRIKGSLQALAETYQSFFDLSEAVKKILPL